LNVEWAQVYEATYEELCIIISTATYRARLTASGGFRQFSFSQISIASSGGLFVGSSACAFAFG